MLQITLKHLRKKSTNLTKRDELFYSKNAQLEILNLEWICIAPFHKFCSEFFYSAFFCSLKLITSRASEFFAIFIIKESIKKDELKAMCSFFDQSDI